VTVVGAEGTANMNTQAKEADELITVLAHSLPRASANDYRFGRGGPWIILSPEHAACLGSLSKSRVKERLWNESKLAATRFSPADRVHIQDLRRSELGTIANDMMLPVCRSPDLLGLIVAGGPGTHSLHVASFGVTTAVTRAITA
jgi:hypothetical protein